MRGDKHRTMIITGLDIIKGEGDDSFTNDFATWNVSKMWRDCVAGKHGHAWAVDVEEAYQANKGVEVDEDKVVEFMTRPDILVIPAICVMEDGMSWFVEGHHRLRAHHRLGIPTIRVFVIEEEYADQYRVLFNGKRRIEDA